MLRHSQVKLDLSKWEHFQDFLCENLLLQYVAYRIIKYSSGDVQTVPHAVIATFKHIISSYFQFCLAKNVQQLSQNTL